LNQRRDLSCGLLQVYLGIEDTRPEVTDLGKPVRYGEDSEIGGLGLVKLVPAEKDGNSGSGTRVGRRILMEF
jgi:hypothetical protein